VATPHTLALVAMPLDRTDNKGLMTLRGIWILNFVTTALSLAILALGLLNRIDLSKSDKDIIIVYLVVLIGLYLALLTYLFYQRIFRWGMKKRTPYYITTLVTVVISLIILLQISLTATGTFTMRLVVVSILCTANVLTYFWGLQRNRIAE
jgi:hypothetical protein